MLTINTAPAPLREKLAPLNIGDVPRGGVISFPQGPEWNMMDFVDPVLTSDCGTSHQSHDLFRAAYWTPVGYSHLGG